MKQLLLVLVAGLVIVGCGDDKNENPYLDGWNETTIASATSQCDATLKDPAIITNPNLLNDATARNEICSCSVDASARKHAYDAFNTGLADATSSIYTDYISIVNSCDTNSLIFAR